MQKEEREKIDSLIHKDFDKLLDESITDVFGMLIFDIKHILKLLVNKVIILDDKVISLELEVKALKEKETTKEEDFLS